LSEREFLNFYVPDEIRHVFNRNNITTYQALLKISIKGGGMEKNGKHKFLVMMDEIITSGILDTMVMAPKNQERQIHYNLNGKELNHAEKRADSIFVDLYRELIDRLKMDRPPCIRCPDSVINECAKTAHECMIFKKYLSKGYCA